MDNNELAPWGRPDKNTVVNMVSMKQKLTMAVVVAASTFGAVNASAEYLPEDRASEQQASGFEMVLEYLKTRQLVPNRLEFRKLSADPVADLTKIASGRYEASVRVRAIESLALYTNDDRAIDTIDDLVARVGTKSKLFGPALVTWVAMHGESVVDAVMPYATHRDANVRMAAVVALGRYGGQAGFDRLKELKSVENDEVVRDRIAQIVD